MTDGRWTYRIGTFDGPARAGSLEKDRKVIPLPVLLRQNARSEGDRCSLVPLTPGWEGIGVEFDQAEEAPGSQTLLLEQIGEHLNRIGTGALKGVLSGSILRMTLIDSEGASDAELLSSRFLPVLMTDPREMARTLSRLKQEFPAHPPLWVPGGADGNCLEALLHLGVEVFDTYSAVPDAMKGLFYTASGSLPYDEVDRSGGPARFCPCQACKGLSESSSNGKKWRLLVEHNSGVLERRLTEASIHLRRGTLRKHVMGVLSGKPEWLSAIRLMEGGAWSGLPLHTHSWKPLERVEVTYRDDLGAPDFHLFSRRIKEEYEPPSSRDILLLLPCSAKKPYSSSRTHKRIMEVLRGIAGLRERVHMVVLTSPLGAVPMELEDLYPASSYDIPVTGQWFHEETELSRDLVHTMLSRGAYREVVCFHGEGYQFFPDEARSGAIGAIPFLDVHSKAKEDGREPLDLLKEILAGSIGSSMARDRAFGPEVEERLGEVKFSLGIDLSEARPLRMVRKGETRFLSSGGKDLVRFTNGGPVPTLAGGAYAWGLTGRPSGKKVVIEDFVPRGTIFAHGIRSADPSIHPGDVVLVGSEKGFSGVGRALVPGIIMASGRRGPAVRMISHESA